MSSTLDFIFDNLHLNRNARSPIEIPDFGRDGLARLFASLQFKRGAEIGVERGIYSEILCKANPKLTLFSIDAWQAYSDYREHVSQGKLDQIHAEAKERLAPYRCTLIRKFSMDAVKDFSPESLDFVYIDANHEFQQFVNDLCEWSKRVRKGGIVAGHDYMKRKDSGYQVHVAEALGAYIAAYHISPYFILGSKAKIEGEVRDSPRSWMWIKT